MKLANGIRLNMIGDIVINPELMKALKEKISIHPMRIHQLINRTQQENSIVDRETAAGVLAYNNGIQIDRFLSEEDLTKVQAALYRVPRVIERKREMAWEKPTVLRVTSFDALSADRSILSNLVVEEASKMSAIYPYFYVFENSIRNVIQKVMERAYGPDWWNAKGSNPMKKKAGNRIAQDGKNRWHGKRGAHPINYVDIEDLSDIITTNWQDFEKLFPSQHWVKANIEIITLSRNVVAHNNPLTDDDIESVKVRFREWTNQVKDIEEILK